MVHAVAVVFPFIRGISNADQIAISVNVWGNLKGRNRGVAVLVVPAVPVGVHVPSVFVARCRRLVWIVDFKGARDARDRVCGG